MADLTPVPSADDLPASAFAPTPLDEKAIALTRPPDAAPQAHRVARGVLPSSTPSRQQPTGDNTYGGGSNADMLANGSAGVAQASQAPPNWMDRNRNWVIPLLSGVGRMASSDSRYLGSALLQGLGASAEAYGKEREDEANLGKGALGQMQQGAGLGQTKAETTGLNERNAIQNMIVHTAHADYLPIRDAQGGFKMVNADLYMSGAYPNASPLPYKEYLRAGGLPVSEDGAGMDSKIGASGPAAAPSGALTAAPAPGGAAGFTLSPFASQTPEELRKQLSEFQEAGRTASQMVPVTNKQALNTALMAQQGEKGGLGTVGWESDARQNIVNALHTLVRMGGGAPGQYNASETLAGLAQKYGIMGAFNSARNNHQDSFAAFEAALHSLSPNSNQTPEMMRDLQAQVLYAQQYQRDYANEAANFVNTHPGQGLTNFPQEFAKTHTPQRYAQEINFLTRLLRNPNMVRTLSAGGQGLDPVKWRAALEHELTTKNDAPPEMTRYFQ